MDFTQMDLFSWQNETLAEGYQKLAAFRFDEAQSLFKEIKKKYDSVNPETEEAIHCTGYWKNVTGQLDDNKSASSVSFLYTEISRYPFPKTWGMQLLRSALIRHLIGLMQKHNTIYVNDETTQSDLFLQLNQPKKAEHVLAGQLSVHPQDNNLRFRLAGIQWHNGQKGEAIRNYTLGLLRNPDLIPLNYLEYRELSDLIEHYGPAMTPAFGWISGLLPLLVLPDNIPVTGKTHTHALDCYRLLRKAEKASNERDTDATFKYRKALHDLNPGLYHEYFDLLSKRKLPR